MEIKIIKVYATETVSIQPRANPAIPTNLSLKIPPNGYGKFYLRKRWVASGLIAPDLPFHPQWSGRDVTIFTQNKSDYNIEIQLGEEIGELWIHTGVTFRFEDNPIIQRYTKGY